jgi:ecotin
MPPAWVGAGGYLNMLAGGPEQKMTWKLCAALLFLLPQLVQAGDKLDAFPLASPGMTRHVVELPAVENEPDLRVELIVGKLLKLDQGNRYFLAGGIEAETLKGWGYTFYSVAQVGPLAGTLMAVDPALPKVRRFITLGGEPYLVRYNSRLPVVVYAPDDAEVRYRVWRADPRQLPIPSG